MGAPEDATVCATCTLHMAIALSLYIEKVTWVLFAHLVCLYTLLILCCFNHQYYQHSTSQVRITFFSFLEMYRRLHWPFQFIK